MSTECRKKKNIKHKPKAIIDGIYCVLNFVVIVVVFVIFGLVFSVNRYTVINAIMKNNVHSAEMNAVNSLKMYG